MTSTETEPLVNTQRVADELGVTVKTIYRYKKAGRIKPKVELDKGDRWLMSEVFAQLAAEVES